MKCAKCRRRQCSMMVVVVLLAEALLFSFAANAAPRGADDAVRGTSKSGSEVMRLVTGDPAQINGAIAGVPPTAILAVNPVPVPAGVMPPNPYPPGTTIVGNELRAEVGGFRAWFNAQLSNWDPDGDGPNLATYQVKIDCTNYQGVNAVPPNPGVDLAPAVVACPGGDPTPCVVAFGEAWAACNQLGDGNCDAGYLDLAQGRADSWCAPNGGGCAAYIASIGTCNYNFAAASNSQTGHPDEPSTCLGGARNGGGCSVAGDCPLPGTCTGPRPVYYSSTLVLDIPAGAKGKYTVLLNQDETFVAIPGDPFPPVVIESLAENGFVVNIVTGQCCFGLGTPDEGCVDGVLRAECGGDEPPPFIFIPEELCPPQGSDCRSYLGACCDTRDGSCDDWQPFSSCRGTHSVWTSEFTCDEVACVADQGACCDTLNGQCEDQVFEFYCQGTQRTWSRNTSCIDAECTSQTGACCHGDPFGPCTDDTLLSDCQCPTCTWHKLQACTEIVCDPTPIPTVSEWGLAILTLLLLTAAKVYFGRRAGEARIASQQFDH